MGCLKSVLGNSFLSKPPAFLDISVGKLQEGDLLFPVKMGNNGLVGHWKNKNSKLHFYLKVIYSLTGYINSTQ